MVDEKTWITKAKDGDREALNHVISYYWQPIYRLIYSKVGNGEDARELTQDTFMKAFRALPQYKIQDVSFKSYLGRIAVNVVTDFWRKSGRTPKVTDITDYQETLCDTGEKPEDYALRQEGRDEMADLVNRLPEEQRQAVQLRVIMGLSIRDAAVRMNKTEAAIKMLQSRALKNLREMGTSMGIWQ